MNIDINGFILTLALGGAVGLFHFGGLWFTIHRLTRVRSPEVEFVLSFFLRTGISVAAFFFISGGKWERILAALAGFLLARSVMVRRIGPIPKAFDSRSEDRVHGY